MEENQKCSHCKKRPANHQTAKWWETPQVTYSCCKCYVENGNAPADWHPLCMSTYEQLNKKQTLHEILKDEIENEPDTLTQIIDAMEEDNTLSDIDAINIAKAYYINPQTDAFYLQHGREMYECILKGRTRMHNDRDFDGIFKYLKSVGLPVKA